MQSCLDTPFIFATLERASGNKLNELTNKSNLNQNFVWSMIILYILIQKKWIAMVLTYISTSHL